MTTWPYGFRADENNPWPYGYGVHSPERMEIAYAEGYASGIYFGGEYMRGMNPYTSYAPGVELYRLWRLGYMAAAAQARRDRGIACPDCDGEGRIGEWRYGTRDKCKTCKGYGWDLEGTLQRSGQ